MTIVVDNNGAGGRVRGRQGCPERCAREWEERPRLVQEKSPTGHSCNPRTEPSLPLFEFRAGLKVENGYAVGKRGFSEATALLDVAKAVEEMSHAGN